MQSAKYGHQRVWKETIQSGSVNLHVRYALRGDNVDESGQDVIHQFLYSPNINAKESILPKLRAFRWGFTGDSESQSYFDVNKQDVLSVQA